MAAVLGHLRMIGFLALAVLAACVLGGCVALGHRAAVRAGSTGALGFVGALLAYDAPVTGQTRLDAEGEAVGSVDSSTVQTVSIDYTSMAAAGTVSTTVSWDDNWFFSDPTVYHHDLATTCSVLSALANSESGYYQAGNPSPAYAEDALSALGFEDICTESYRYRSEIVDQVLDFVTQENDVAAYALATKPLRSVDGVDRTLILATVRGSYGAEWFSNLKMQETRADGAPSADHTGYTQAADELYQRVAAIVEQERAAGCEPVVLLCGHSRGGAIANIVAARLLDRYTQSNASSGSYAVSVGPSGSPGEGSLVPVSTGVQASAAGDAHLPVYAYTFAAPAVTTNPDIHADRYSGIFNIQNPADLMPQLPLERWGYGRYGQDIALPGVGDAAFSRLYDDMRERFAQNVGVESAYDPRDRATVDDLVARLGERFDTPASVSTPEGAFEIVRTLIMDADVPRLLCAHYPDTYIAWMQAATAEDLLVQDR